MSTSFFLPFSEDIILRQARIIKHFPNFTEYLNKTYLINKEDNIPTKTLQKTLNPFENQTPVIMTTVKKVPHFLCTTCILFIYLYVFYIVD